VKSENTVLISVCGLIVVLCLAVLLLATKIGKTESFAAQPLGSRQFQQ